MALSAFFLLSCALYGSTSGDTCQWIEIVRLCCIYPFRIILLGPKTLLQFIYDLLYRLLCC